MEEVRFDEWQNPGRSSLEVPLLPQRGSGAKSPDELSSSEGSPKRRHSPNGSPLLSPLHSLSSSSENSPRRASIEALRSVDQLPKDDLILLSLRLHQISEAHFQDLWRPDGPMSQATRGQMLCHGNLALALPELHLIYQGRSEGECVNNFLRLFLDAKIHGTPLQITKKPLESIMDSEIFDAINPTLNAVLDFQINFLTNLINTAFKKPVKFLTEDQRQHLLRFYDDQIHNVPPYTEAERIKYVQLACIKETLRIMNPDQQDLMLGSMQRRQPELFRQFPGIHREIRTLITNRLIPAARYSTFTNDYLVHLFNNVTDDYDFLNNSWGLAFRDERQDAQFDGNRTFYSVNNILVKELTAYFSTQNNDTPNSDFNRLHTLYSVCNNTIAFNKNTQAKNNRVNNDAQANDNNVNNDAQANDEGVCVYLMVDEQGPQPPRHGNQAQSPAQSAKVAEEAKKKKHSKQLNNLCNALSGLYASQHMLRLQENHGPIADNIASQYQASMTEVHRFLYFSGDNQRHLAEYLNMPLPQGELNYIDFLAAVKHRYSEIPRAIDPPVYKERLTEIIGHFFDSPQHSDYTLFHAELKKFSQEYRPKSTIKRFFNCIGAALWGERGEYARLREQYRSIEQLESTVFRGFKDMRKALNAKMTQSTVSSVLKTKPHEFRDEATLSIDLTTLYEREKDRLAGIETSPMSQRMIQDPTYKETKKLAADQENPVYQQAVTSLHNATANRGFFSSKSTVPKLKSKERALDTLVELTAAEQSAAHIASQHRQPISLTHTNKAKAQVTAFFEKTRNLEFKTQVAAHLVGELAPRVELNLFDEEMSDLQAESVIAIG